MGEKLDLLIKGNLVLPDEVVEASRVGVKAGKIVGLYGSGDAPEAAKTVDATGKLVFPGMVDAHVHSYSDPDETFEHATPAAAAGGVTTIVEMPYDAIGKISTTDLFDKKLERIKKLARVDVAMLATLEKEGCFENIAPLVEKGIVGFKLSDAEADPVRFPRIEDGVLWETFHALAPHGLPVGFHAENDRIINTLIDRLRKEEKTYPKAHCESRPPATETVSALKLLELAYWTGVKLHIYHVSHPRTVRLVELYKEQGVDVTLETCPHYLLLNEDDMDRLKAFAKINPPMREKDAVEEMWEMVKCGMIDMITSDHGPWPLNRKQSPNIFDNPSGAPGVETIFPLLFSEGVKKRQLSPSLLAQLVCEGPARRFLVYPRKGRIALGADADFAIFDPDISWTIKTGDMHSSAGWTPFDGMTVEGKIIRTILRGETVYDGKEVTAEPGYGQFIPRIDGE
jgi:allantoinase